MKMKTIKPLRAQILRNIMKDVGELNYPNGTQVSQILAIAAAIGSYRLIPFTRPFSEVLAEMKEKPYLVFTDAPWEFLRLVFDKDESELILQSHTWLDHREFRLPILVD